MNETPEENKTLCHAPWTHLDINLTKDTVLPCCMYKKPTLGSTENIMKIWTGEELSQLRQTFLSGEGIKNENCEHCYLTEPFSYRRHLSHKIEFYLNSDIYDANDLQLPVSMNISIDNTCNLSCRTCSPSFSSKVAALYKKSPLFNNKVFYLETKKKDIDSFADSFENLHVVNLMGGEPLYSKNTIHLIRKIKEKAKNFKEITLVSNMMTRNIEIFEELKTIPNTEITISIDGDRDINNYVRAESDFDTIRDNIKFITENYPNIKLSINSTISALTIGYIPELIKALHQLAIDTGAKFEKVKSSIALNPVPISPVSLPQHVKDIYIEKLEKFDNSICQLRRTDQLVPLSLQLLKTPPEPKHSPEKFYEYIKELDRLLGTDYKKLYPEF